MGLFNTTYIHKETKLVPVTKRVIHEGMSGDRATQVLADFEAKAKANIVQAFTTAAGDNAVKGSVTVFSNPASLDHEAVVSFTINGRKHTVSQNLPSSRCMTNKEAVSLLAGEVAKALAVELILEGGSNLRELQSFRIQKEA